MSSELQPSQMTDAAVSAEQTTPDAPPPDFLALVRYGRVPQVARFGLSGALRDTLLSVDRRLPDVVVQTDRGEEVGALLEVIRPGLLTENPSITGDLLRLATESDRSRAAENSRDADTEFFDWQQRIADWDLQLQVIDMEWTLDRDNVILYVLNDQNAETTRLALLAAAGGYGIIHVQPVNADGIDYAATGGGGGCGSGGCGSGGCGTGH
ncbi:MAG: hypothetical protein NXI04_27800 [Planctomycetaceae bacterium]|nr:hypothetical protein [Planctomycetaceae bacterium]